MQDAGSRWPGWLAETPAPQATGTSCTGIPVAVASAWASSFVQTNFPQVRIHGRVVQYDPLTHCWFVQGQLQPYTCRVSINNTSHGRGGWRHDEIRCGLGAGAAPPPRQVGRIHACSTATCSTMSGGVVAARL